MSHLSHLQALACAAFPPDLYPTAEPPVMWETLGRCPEWEYQCNLVALAPYPSLEELGPFAPTYSDIPTVKLDVKFPRGLWVKPLAPGEPFRLSVDAWACRLCGKLPRTYRVEGVTVLHCSCMADSVTDPRTWMRDHATGGNWPTGYGGYDEMSEFRSPWDGLGYTTDPWLYGDWEPAPSNVFRWAGAQTGRFPGGQLNP